MPTAEHKVIRYKASSPTAEYPSTVVSSFFVNLRSDIIQPILEKHGLSAVNLEDWYPQQLILDILQDMEKRFTFEELVAVGMKVAEVVPLPPNINSIESFLAFTDPIYKAGTRHTPEWETVTVEKVAERHFRLMFNVPIPPFVNYGFMFGTLRRLRGHNQQPIIQLTDEGTPYFMDVKW